MSTSDAADAVPESSVWAGWEHAKAAAWADALLAFERHRFTTTAQHMLLLALWHDWHDRGSLPELRRWEQLARRFESQGVTAAAFERFHRDAGATPWSPAVDRPCQKALAGAA
ncbi:hypothetical protein [Agrococcus sp. DT81.2]|uniref:hypothetical protein n=1 Tax=Agrococcus sp. DT81.2 TaxID=3393414 RepID=UPI003CE48C0D